MASWQTAHKAFVSFLGLVELVSLFMVSNRSKLEGSRECCETPRTQLGAPYLLDRAVPHLSTASCSRQEGAESQQKPRYSEVATMSFADSSRLF